MYKTAAILILIILTSCGSPKNIWYFQEIENVANTFYQDHTNAESRIIPNDNLFITVATTTVEAADPYNNINTRTSGSMGNMELQGYLVNTKGEINFPGIGRIHVSGLTRDELVNILQAKLSQYIENPIVNVRIMNYSIAVLGAVNRPGVYGVTGERISIPEALALAGDLTIYGQRRNILVCRLENGEKKFYQVDLTSPDIFFSEVYYLQQRDIVYIKPNKSNAAAASVNPLVGTWLSVTGILISVATLVITITRTTK
ncbi:polysaccharide biosynthesis protein [Bacteroidia bacterium]|nr:polysaccharide biosynthesis protein [Bacteroidia bacterium]